MARLSKAVCIAAGLALLIDATGALAQGGMRGSMGGARMSSNDVERLRRTLPQYDARAEYAEGLAALRVQDFRRAALAGRHITEAIPTSVDAWRLLGAAYAGDGDWKGSRRAYERIIRLSPDDANAHAGLGLALAGLKDAKAQGQLDWLRNRVRACGDTCPDAARLKAFTAPVESALNDPAALPPGVS